MPVIDVTKDADARTMTITATFDAPETGSGRCGATRDSWNAGGVRRPTRPRSSTTTSPPVGP
jgi:hypothetical protein